MNRKSHCTSNGNNKLIKLIRDLNPHVQIILTTHSPAVIMNGWMDRCD